MYQHEIDETKLRRELGDFLNVAGPAAGYGLLDAIDEGRIIGGFYLFGRPGGVVRGCPGGLLAYYSGHAGLTSGYNDFEVFWEKAGHGIGQGNVVEFVKIGFNADTAKLGKVECPSLKLLRRVLLELLKEMVVEIVENVEVNNELVCAD